MIKRLSVCLIKSKYFTKVLHKKLYTVMEGDRCVLSIQSHVVHGYVGNRSATFPLQVLGFDVDVINSVQFSNHTGYESFNGQVLNDKHLTDLYSGLTSNDLNHYSHLLTGYIGSESFLLAVKDVIEDLKRVNPKLIYVCDPVLGDDGKLYVPEALVSVYKNSILPLADIITPNQFEAEMLTGIEIVDLDSARRAMNSLHEMGVKTVVLTSSHLGSQDVLVCLASRALNGKSCFMRIDIPKLPTSFTGSGDLFAALLLAWTDKHPDDLKLACEKVVSTMQKVLTRTYSYITEHCSETSSASMKHRELRLIQSKQDIEDPQISIQAVVQQQYNSSS